MEEGPGVTGYPRTDREERVAAPALRDLVGTMFGRCGMSGEDAALLADTLIVADLQGVHSHGVLRVPEYVRKLRAEGVDPRGRPRVVTDRGAALVVDGGNSMGQVGAAFAMRRAIERACDTNVAVAAVRGSNHCGAMAYYATMALPQDMVGLAATSALPTMAPWGGVDKILGINPLAVAIPAGREGPVVFDAAFSASSHGKIRVYHQKGAPLPPDWAFDSDGRPTTDPVVALAGLLRPVGGYKGTGLALVWGLLATLLSGAAYGTELGSMVDGPQAGQDGHVFLALRVAGFEEPARFKTRVDAVVRQIRACRRAPGVKRVYPPGHLEAETARRYTEEGIPLTEATLAALEETARALGCDTGTLVVTRSGPTP
jgi:LDH2 family malate/lactate/ureidoglycolate dehydrogenase